MVRQFLSIVWLALWMGLGGVAAARETSGGVEQAALSVGVAVADITPEEGAARDPLLAKVIVPGRPGDVRPDQHCGRNDRCGP
jgi:hypothetical protein